jgi:hypothetical protein
MSERKEITVDEKFLQQVIAGDVPMHSEKVATEEPTVEPVEKSEPKREAKGKRNVTGQSDFAELFLKENRLSDRRMVYVSKDTYEKLVRYVSVISDRRLGLVGYVDNIVAHHIESYKTAINEMYESRIGCKVFKS